MATEKLRSDNADRNKGLHEGPNVGGETEIVLLKARVASVETAVTDIRAGVQKLLDRPQNPGFTQVITTLVATLSFCTFIFGFAEWRLGQAVAPVTAELTTMQTQARWAADSVHATNIKAAVLEERMNWVKELAKGKTP